MFYHTDVFHHWSLGKLNYSTSRFSVNNKGKLFLSKNLNKYKLFCLNFVPFYCLKLVAYQDTVKQIYWTDTWMAGWSVRWILIWLNLSTSSPVSFATLFAAVWVYRAGLWLANPSLTGLWVHACWPDHLSLHTLTPPDSHPFTGIVLSPVSCHFGHIHLLGLMPPLQ